MRSGADYLAALKDSRRIYLDGAPVDDVTHHPAFAPRHHQYEMFYAGAPFVVKGYSFRNYGFDGPVAEVEDFLSSYGV